MAKEYIEREAALKLLKDDERYGYLGIVDIQSIPTADVVEVVRCKDCVNGTVCVNLQGAEYVDCHYDDYAIRKPMDFCSDGERRDNDG